MALSAAVPHPATVGTVAETWRADQIKSQDFPGEQEWARTIRRFVAPRNVRAEPLKSMEYLSSSRVSFCAKDGRTLIAADRLKQKELQIW